jgi:CRP-like cAMP-binding protein
MDKIGHERLLPFALFNGLNSTQFDEIVQYLRLRRYTAGEEIVREGETGGELFLLFEGEIEISKRLTLYSRDGMDQKEKSLVSLKAEDNIFFGEMTLFDQPERSATVTALTDVTLGILTREQIKLLAEQDPSIGYYIFQNIGRALTANLRRANRDILKLTTAFCLALERG